MPASQTGRDGRGWALTSVSSIVAMCAAGREAPNVDGLVLRVVLGLFRGGLDFQMLG